MVGLRPLFPCWLLTGFALSFLSLPAFPSTIFKGSSDRSSPHTFNLSDLLLSLTSPAFYFASSLWLTLLRVWKQKQTFAMDKGRTITDILWELKWRPNRAILRFHFSPLWGKNKTKQNETNNKKPKTHTKN